MARRREVFYTLGAQRNGDTSGTIKPISTHALYTDALADGLDLPRGWHMRIERVSLPSGTSSDKFVWHEGDVIFDD